MNPFTALCLPADPGLTDDQVRQAWRTVAAQTHPDRDDGGDPAAYTAASAAYGQLRTGWGRSEALADLAAGPHPPPAAPAARAPGAGARDALLILPARIRHGRPWRITARAAAAAGVGLLAVTVIPGTPAAPAIAAGCALWWALTSRGDLAPPPGR